jgi:hypothetical protein
LAEGFERELREVVLVGEVFEGEGGHRGREPETGGAVRIRSISWQEASKTASAHAGCLGWKGGHRSALACR